MLHKLHRIPSQMKSMKNHRITIEEAKRFNKHYNKIKSVKGLPLKVEIEMPQMIYSSRNKWMELILEFRMVLQIMLNSNWMLLINLALRKEMNH